jgi:hypothetical protein
VAYRIGQALSAGCDEQAHCIAVLQRKFALQTYMYTDGSSRVAELSEHILFRPACPFPCAAATRFSFQIDSSVSCDMSAFSSLSAYFAISRAWPILSWMQTPRIEDLLVSHQRRDVSAVLS